MKKYRIIISIISILVLNACKDSVIGPLKNKNTTETQLGAYNYYIDLPNEFILEEVNGRGGELWYRLIPKDKNSTMNGSIQIKQGFGPKGIPTKGISTEKVTSFLLNKKVNWIIENITPEYYVGNSDFIGNIKADAGSNNRREVLYLISIIATLKQK
jgi:hypothetical protein